MNIDISGELNTIADALNKRFSELDSIYEQSEVVNFIKSEIHKDFALKKPEFNGFLAAFERTASTTLNKDEFIKGEIENIDLIINSAFYGISGHERIINAIRQLVVINRSDIDIFGHFFHKYFRKRNDIYVRIVYTHDLIKYKCYIEGGTWQQQPDSLKTTQHSRNNGTSTKAGRPKAKPKQPELYIQNVLPDFKLKFVEALKNEFKNSNSRELSAMIRALINMGHLNEPTNFKALFLSFNNYFELNITYSQINRDFNKDDKDYILAVEKKIGRIKNQNGII